MQKYRLFWLVLLVLIPLSFSHAQEMDTFTRRYHNGALFYGMERFQEAAFEFRRAQESAPGMNEWSQALYWVILSQLAYSDFGSALLDMEELERRAPDSTFAKDIIYHRARVYYNQGYFQEALQLFNRYNISSSDSDQESADRRAAAYFWMGECLYSMGQFDEAEKFYAWVIGRYPRSPKVEASSYRLDLIKQKKIEAELLALLQWSHEESLRTSEEYQRTIRTYEHTLNLYQRRILELSNINGLNLNDTSAELADIPSINQINQPSITQTAPVQGIEETYISDVSANHLLERARQLESTLQDILREHNNGGSSSGGVR